MKNNQYAVVTKQNAMPIASTKIDSLKIFFFYSHSLTKYSFRLQIVSTED